MCKCDEISLQTFGRKNQGLSTTIEISTRINKFVNISKLKGMRNVIIKSYVIQVCGRTEGELCDAE